MIYVSKKPHIRAHSSLLKVFDTLVLMGVKIESIPEVVGTKFVRTQIYPRRMVRYNYELRKAIRALKQDIG